MTNNIKRNFVWNMIGTAFNAFNSLFFMVIVTRINGVKEAGIFAFAFTVAILLNIIALYAGRVYQVTDRTKITDRDFIIHKVITCLIMLFIAIVYTLISQYSIHKSIILLLLCLYKLLESFPEVIYAILQKDDNLFKVGKSLTIKGVFGLLVLFLVDIITKDLIFSLICVLITNLIIIFTYDISNLKNSSYNKCKTNFDNIWSIFKKGFFAFSIAFLTFYITSSPKYVIDKLSTDEYQTIFSILIMPATMVSLMTQFIIHPFLLGIKLNVAESNYQKLRINIEKFLLVIFAIGCFSTFASYIIGIPFLNFIYSLDLNEYRNSLILIMMGATLYALTSIISTVLIAMRYTFIQALNYFIISFVATLISITLVQRDVVMGASVAYLIIMVLVFIVFLITIIICIKKRKQRFRSDN